MSGFHLAAQQYCDPFFSHLALAGRMMSDTGRKGSPVGHRAGQTACERQSRRANEAKATSAELWCRFVLQQSWILQSTIFRKVGPIWVLRLACGFG